MNEPNLFARKDPGMDYLEFHENQVKFCPKNFLINPLLLEY